MRNLLYFKLFVGAVANLAWYYTFGAIGRFFRAPDFTGLHDVFEDEE